MADFAGPTDDDLATIERQLDKLESTATNLESLAFVAKQEGNDQQALDLEDQAGNLRVQQFKLYRQKQQIEVNSPQWTGFVASLEVVNHFIEQSMDDLTQVATVINDAAQLASIIDGLMKMMAVA